MRFIITEDGTLRRSESRTAGNVWEIPQGTQEVTVPEGVRRIAPSAFYRCGSLRAIRLPEGLEEIGEHAFDTCTGLEEIELPESVTEIGPHAFWGCCSLKRFRVPAGIAALPDMLFGNCIRLREVQLPEGLTRLGNGVFCDCVALASLRIPASVQTIGAKAFARCRTLRAIAIPEGVRILQVSLFTDCSALEEVTLPESVDIIGDFAFRGCEALTSLRLPAGLRSIGRLAFGGCAKLAELPLPEGLAAIGPQAFLGCRRLRVVHIPDTVTRIGALDFGDNASPACIRLPLHADNVDFGDYRRYPLLTLINVTGEPFWPAGRRTFWLPWDKVDSAAGGMFRSAPESFWLKVARQEEECWFTFDGESWQDSPEFFEYELVCGIGPMEVSEEVRWPLLLGFMHVSRAGDLRLEAWERAFAAYVHADAELQRALYRNESANLPVMVRLQMISGAGLEPITADMVEGRTHTRSEDVLSWEMWLAELRRRNRLDPGLLRRLLPEACTETAALLLQYLHDLPRRGPALPDTL